LSWSDQFGIQPPMKLVLIAMIVVMGCGTDESAEERICSAANGCGALASANVDLCVSKLETVDASRALTECADCLETNTCAQITAGACSGNCSPFASVFTSDAGGNGTYDRNKKPSQLTPAERQTYCEWQVAQLGGPDQREMCTYDGRQITFVTGDVADCVSQLTTTTCTVTMGMFEACYNNVDSPCDLLTAPGCDVVLDCAP
jgi:hypothetical protein